MDRVFGLISDDPDMGPKLRDADVPQRWEFDDLDLVVDIRADRRRGRQPALGVERRRRLEVQGPDEDVLKTANKYFQGKENVPLAIAKRKIKTGGDMKAALALIPITKPVYPQFRALVEDEYPHLRL